MAWCCSYPGSWGVLWLNCTDDGLEFQKKIGPTMAVIKGIQYLLFLLIGLWIATSGFTHNPLDQ